MSRAAGRNEVVSTYLYARPIEYTLPDERKRKESKLAITCVQEHRSGCRCWKEPKE